MSGRQAALVAVLSAILAACSAGASPAPSMLVSADPSHGSSPLGRVSPTPTTVVLTPAPSATATPTPRPTQQPLPPKPTGVKVSTDAESLCDNVCEESTDWDHTVSWKKPLTKGVEIRVYGVTECLSDDLSGAMIDGGWCLRERTANDIYGTLIDGVPVLEHTALPSSMLELLAKAPASKGRVTWRMSSFRLGFLSDPADPQHADALFAIVAAAYDADGGQSAFAIVTSGHLCDVIESLECPDDWEGGVPG